jgi:hypothetical protein
MDASTMKKTLSFLTIGFPFGSAKNIWAHICKSLIAVAFILCGSTHTWADRVYEENESRDLKEVSYPEVGLTTSSLLISPNLGYWFGQMGVRFSGMYLGEDHNEAHLNWGYKWSDTAMTQHSINLLMGKIVGSDPGADYDYTYLGVAYSLNFTVKGYRGFFIALGMAKVLDDNLGNLADDPFVPCGSLGYMYRFTPK